MGRKRKKMELPTPYIFQIDTPLIIFNTRLIQPKNKTSSNANYIELGSIKYGLEEIVKPKKLEDLYFKHYEEIINQHKRSYARTTMKQELKSKEFVSDELKKNKVLSLIIKEILPTITAARLENQIDELAMEKETSQNNSEYDIFEEKQIRMPQNMVRETEKLKRELIKKIDEEYKHLEPSQNKNTLEEKIFDLVKQGTTSKFSKIDDDSILYQMLKKENIMLIDDKLYGLVSINEYISYFKDHISSNFFNRKIRTTPTNTKPETICKLINENIDQIEKKYLSRIINKIEAAKINIEGRYFLPIYYEKTDNLIQKYKQLLEKRIKIETVEHSNFQTQQLYELAQEKTKLEKIAKQKNFEKNGAGFSTYSGNYFVFIKTPPYALKSPHHEEYFAFPSAKIGVKVRSSGRGFEISDPRVINNYKHPFLSGYDSFQTICLGEYNPSRARRLPPDQAVLTLLSKAKEILMMGYRSGSNPYNRLDSDKFRRISKAKMKREGLICLNENLVDEYNRRRRRN